MEDEDLIKQCTEGELASIPELLRCLNSPISINQIRRAFLMLLRAHYSHAGNYPADLEYINCLTYAPGDPTEDTLSVDLTHNFDPDRTENFPGVFISRPRLTLRKHSMGNHSGGSFDHSREDSSKVAELRFEIRHIAKDESVSADLAESTLILLLGLSPTIRDRMGLLQFEVEGLNEGQDARPKPDKYHQDVISLMIAYEYSASLNLESHRIKKFAVAFAEETC